MSRPLVSVIIPVYNAEKTIGNIIEKLIMQPYDNIEIIAVNDGSKDRSRSILNEYAQKDSRVAAVHQSNGGASAARNRGLDSARGRYVTFIDADDDIDEMLISKLVIGTDDGSDFIVCGMTLNTEQILASDSGAFGGEVTQYVLMSLLRKNLLYGPCCKLFKRSIIEHNKIRFQESVHYGEDTIFVLDYLRFSLRIKNIASSLYTYTISGSGLSSTNDGVVAYRKARTRALDRFIEGNLTFANALLYVLLRLRWAASLVKSRIKHARSREVL